MPNEEYTRAEYLRALLNKKNNYQAQGGNLVNPAISGLAGVDTSFAGVYPQAEPEATNLKLEQSKNGFDKFMDGVLGFIDEMAAKFGAGFVNGWEGILDFGATAIGALGDATGWYSGDTFTNWAKQDIGGTASEWMKTAFGLGQWYNRFRFGDWNKDEWQDIGQSFLDWNKATFFAKNDLGNERAELSDKYYKADDEVLNQMGQFGGFLGGAAHSIGFMLPSIMTAGAASTSAGAQAISLGTIGVGAAGKGSEEALNDGATSGQALGYGALTGVAEAASELVVGKALGLVGLGTGKIAGVVGKGSAKTTAKIGSKLFAKQLAQTMFEEGMEEVSTAVLEPLFKSVYKGKESLEDYKSMSFWFGTDGHFNESVLGQFASGAFVGGLSGGIHQGAVYRKVGADGYVALQNFQNLSEEDTKMAKLEVQKKTDGKAYIEATNARTKAMEDFIKSVDKLMQNGTEAQKKAFAEFLTNKNTVAKWEKEDKNLESNISKFVDKFASHESAEIESFRSEMNRRFGTDFEYEIEKGEIKTDSKGRKLTAYIDGNKIIINENVIKQKGGSKIAHEYMAHHLLKSLPSEIKSKLFRDVQNTEWFKNEGGKELADELYGDQTKEVYNEEAFALYMEHVFKGDNVATQIENMRQVFGSKGLFSGLQRILRGAKKFKSPELIKQYAKTLDKVTKAMIKAKIYSREYLSNFIKRVDELKQLAEQPAYSKETKIEKQLKSNILSRYNDFLRDNPSLTGAVANSGEYLALIDNDNFDINIREIFKLDNLSRAESNYLKSLFELGENYDGRQFTKLLRQGISEIGKYRRNVEGNGVSAYENRGQKYSKEIGDNARQRTNKLSETDSEGRKLTEAQAEFFKDSKIRDENGNLKVLFHGSSTGGFNVFDIEQSTFNEAGVGFYFSDNETTAKEYERFHNGNSQKTYKVYLNITNAVNPYEITLKQFNSIVDLFEKKTGKNFVEEYNKSSKQGWKNGRGVCRIRDWINKINNVRELLKEEGDQPPINFYEEIVSQYLSNEEILDLITEATGIDGFISFSYYDGSEEYIAFRPDQIKKVSNLNPTENDDIRYSKESGGVTGDWTVGDNKKPLKVRKKTKGGGYEIVVDGRTLTEATVGGETIADVLVEGGNLVYRNEGGETISFDTGSHKQDVLNVQRYLKDIKAKRVERAPKPIDKKNIMGTFEFTEENKKEQNKKAKELVGELKAKDDKNSYYTKVDGNKILVVRRIQAEKTKVLRGMPTQKQLEDADNLTVIKGVKITKPVYVLDEDGNRKKITIERQQTHTGVYVNKATKKSTVFSDISTEEFNKLENNKAIKITEHKIKKIDSYKVTYNKVAAEKTFKELKSFLSSFTRISNNVADFAKQKLYDTTYYVLKEGKIIEYKLQSLKNGHFNVLYKGVNDAEYTEEKNATWYKMNKTIFGSEKWSTNLQEVQKYKKQAKKSKTVQENNTVSKNKKSKNADKKSENVEKNKKKVNEKKSHNKASAETKSGEKIKVDVLNKDKVKKEVKPKPIEGEAEILSSETIEIKEEEIVDEAPKRTAEDIKNAAELNNVRTYTKAEVERTVRNITKEILKIYKLFDSKARIKYNSENFDKTSQKIFELINKKHVTAEEIARELETIFGDIRIETNNNKTLITEDLFDFIDTNLMKNIDVENIVKNNITELLKGGKESKVHALNRIFKEVRKSLKAQISSLKKTGDRLAVLVRRRDSLRKNIGTFAKITNSEVSKNGFNLLFQPFEKLHRRGIKFNTVDFIESIEQVLEVYNIENWEKNFPDLPFGEEIREKLINLRERTSSGYLVGADLMQECIDTIDLIKGMIEKAQKNYVDKILPSAVSTITSMKNSKYGQSKNVLARYVNMYKRGFAPAYVVIEEILGGNSEAARTLIFDIQLGTNKRTAYIGEYHDQINKQLKDLKIKKTFDSKKLSFRGHELTIDQAMGLYLSTQVQANYDAIEESGVKYYDEKTNKLVEIAKKGEAEALKGEIDRLLPEEYKKLAKWLLSTMNSSVKSEYIEWYKNKYGSYNMRNELGDIGENVYWTLKRAYVKATNLSKAVSNPDAVFSRSISRTGDYDNAVLITGALSTFDSYISQLSKELYIKPYYEDAIQVLNAKTASGETVSEVINSRNDGAKDFKYLMDTMREIIAPARTQATVLDRMVSAFSVAKLSLNIGSMLKQFASIWTSNLPFRKSAKGLIAKMFGDSTIKTEYQELVNDIGGLKYREAGKNVLKANADSAGKFAEKVAHYGMIGISKVDLFTISTGVYSLMIIGQDQFGYKIGTEANKKFVRDNWYEFELSQIGNGVLSKNAVSHSDSLTRYIFGFLQGANRAALGSQIHKWGLWSRNRKVNKEQVEKDLAKAEKALKKAEAEYKANEEDTEIREKYIEAKAKVLELNNALRDYKSYEIAGGKAIPKNMAVGILAQGVFVALVNALMKRLKGKKDWDEMDIAEEATALAMAIGVNWVPLLSQLSSIVQGYEVTVPATEIFNQMSAIFKSGKAGSWKTMIRQIAILFGDMTGVPVQTVYSYIYGMLKTFDPAIAYEMRSVLYGASLQSATSTMKGYAERGNQDKTTSMIGLIMKNYKTGSSTDETNKELARLYINGYSALPKTSMNQYTDDNGNTVKLTNEQIKQFTELYKKSSKDVSNLMNITEYKSATDEEKAKAIQKIYDTYYAVAKAKVTGKQPEGKLAQILALTNGNLSLAKYIISLNKIAQITETAKKTRKELVIQYINRLRGYTKAEKSLLMYLAGYSVSGLSKNSMINFIGNYGSSRQEILSML